MRIADLTQLHTETFVNELDLRRIQVGGEAEITFDAVPGLKVPGRIAEIAPAATLRDNVRVFPTKVAFAVDDPRVRPGISAAIALPVARATQVPAVTISAVFSDAGERVVFVQDGAFFLRRVVTTGLNNLEFVELKTGVQPGDTIALTRPPPALIRAAEAPAAAE
jgi:macrolide-specific efflux system membrane fusion protein